MFAHAGQTFTFSVIGLADEGPGLLLVMQEGVVTFFDLLAVDPCEEVTEVTEVVSSLCSLLVD